MLKIVKNTILLTFSLILLLPLFLKDNLVLANNTINLHFIENSDTNKKIRENVEINIWKITDKENTKTEAEYQKELESLTDQELNQKFSKEEVKEKSNKEGIITLSNLKNGIYYIREVNNKENKNIVPLILKIPSEHKDIYIKTITNPEEKPTGSYKFKKISSVDQKPLKDATFKVTKLENKAYTTVLKNGKNYIVSSSENGEFSVEGLEYGTYYLWEVDAPTGYKQLSEPIKFEITNISKYENGIIIKNEPFTPPPPIIVPNTGDLIFFVLLCGGIILFSLGYRITKEEKQ